MDELDRRIAVGLRELVDRAPVEAVVWDETARYVKQHRRRRQVIAGAAVVALVGVLAVVVAGQVAAPRREVSAGLPAASPEHVVADPCPRNCVGRARADVDGDGRPDRVGYYTERPVQYATSAATVIVRVALASGHVVEYRDTYTGLPALVGASDINRDGRAEIIYLNFLGAHTQSGHILRWDGHTIRPVTVANAQPFLVVSDAYANGITGLRCSGSTLFTVSLSPTDAPNAADGKWSGVRTTYRWGGGRLREVGRDEVEEHGATATREYGIHCPGLPTDTASLFPDAPAETGTTPAQGLPPTTIASQGTAAFLGTWAGHVGAVTIEADGQGSAAWRTYQWCNDTPVGPCDTIDANGLITDGGRATFRITDVRGSSATAIVATSTDTGAVPTGRVELRLVSGNRLQLGTLLVCGPHAAPNACGA